MTIKIGHNKNGEGLPIGKSPTLASEGDPLVTGSGKVIQEDKALDDRDDYSNTVRVADYRPLSRRSLKDLPTSPTALNYVFVVLCYTLCGIPDLQIAEATNTSADDVARARESDAYAESFETMKEEIINVHSEFLEGRIAAYSYGALQTVGKLSKNAKKEAVKLSASKDILDRAQNVNNKQSSMDELRIVISTEGATEVEMSFGKG